ncbi:MAG TPA: ComEC/Rec2 family competence protein [Methanospirillum sp.]|uniref:ComEC/Rec2 family competence protein n=1 Tax=Methanospirillum sp. TaxID=45200 RepID=UPI002C721632|nr:ComEC/Rec2 family competence protein [Methanospirillum sp.]HWQ64756.1 ComEC/Rec2 family competence protein [Methanospirillum sp.]
MRSQFLIIAGIIFLFTLSSGCIASDGNTQLNLTFFDVGQGDACLVQIHNKTMLVDAGPYEAGPGIIDWLKTRNITSLDVVVATHPHSDHIGGMPTVLKQEKTGIFIDAGDSHTTPTYEVLLKTIEKFKIPYRVVHEGDQIDLDPAVTISVLNPGFTYSGDLNDNSIVLEINSGDRKFLLMGDAGIPVEDKLLKEGRDLKADLLKVGHHGSRHSSGRRFIEAVSPEIAIISLEAGNEYGFPQKDPVKYLTDAGSQIYRTDQEGTITVTADQKNLIVKSEKTSSPSTDCNCSQMQGVCKSQESRSNSCCLSCGV